jgi:hypothetical protein
MKATARRGMLVVMVVAIMCGTAGAGRMTKHPGTTDEVGKQKITAVQVSCVREWLHTGFEIPYYLVTEINCSESCELYVLGTLRDRTMRRLAPSEFSVRTDFGLSWTAPYITALFPT